MEMSERTEGFEYCSDEQLRDEYSELESEYSKIDDDFLNTVMPETVKMKYDKIIERVQRIVREAYRRLKIKYETSTIDDDDGKTITINGPCGRSLNVETTRYDSTKVEETGNVPTIENQIYDMLEESMVDDTYSVFDEKAYEDVMNILRDMRITNKANIEDHLERVHAVTVIVQANRENQSQP